MTGAAGRDPTQPVAKAAATVARRRVPARGASKAAPTRRYDPEDTRARILESAYRLFAMHGYSMTGTADIAAEAGVSEGSIFYHFGSKHALLVELGRMHGQRVVARMQADDRPETLTLAVSLNRCFDFFDEHHGRCHDEEEGAAKPGHPAEAEPFFEAAKEIIVGWTKLHLDLKRPAPGGDNLLTARLVFAVVSEAMQQYCASGSADEQRRIRDECVRFCSAAVGQP